jgi:hypothetical protein
MVAVDFVLRFGAFVFSRFHVFRGMSPLGIAQAPLWQWQRSVRVSVYRNQRCYYSYLHLPLVSLLSSLIAEAWSLSALASTVDW